MISKLSHYSFFVLDQERAKDFYVNKLGFEVRMNVPVTGKGAWLTVAPKGQDIEITLIPVSTGIMFDQTTGEQLKKLIEAQAFGFGIFECIDIYATYEELSNKGVEFIKKPTKSDSGMKVEAMFKDDSGNWFSLIQKTEIN